MRAIAKASNHCLFQKVSNTSAFAQKLPPSLKGFLLRQGFGEQDGEQDGGQDGATGVRINAVSAKHERDKRQNLTPKILTPKITKNAEDYSRQNRFPSWFPSFLIVLSAAPA
ncbi:MAG TPA: hypothetical protein VH280_05880 [Verrucomicrobiae bacterium]|jgi:hypothetical protein|nr:hypothetical protein [Verrucomicrobiae bacterium]